MWEKKRFSFFANHMKNYRWAHTTKASQKENIDCQMKIKEMSHEIEIEMNGEEEVDMKKE